MTSTKPHIPSDVVTTSKSTNDILIGLMTPAMMMGLYISMFSVAVPTIRTEFGIQADAAAWVATVYTLPFMMFMPLYGRLGDALGKRRLLLIGIMVFMVGTAVAGLAQDLIWLMVGRAIQGLGGAGFVPLSIATITQLFPTSERGKIMGTWNTIFPFTGIIGPYLGGLFIDHVGWRTIFIPTIVLGLLAIVTVREKVPVLPGFAQPRFLRHFDWVGVALLSSATTSLLFYTASRPVTGIESLRDWRLLASTIVLLAGFLVWEKRHVRPFVQLQIFSNSTFTLASVCAGIRMFIMAGIRFLVPLYVVDIHGLTATTTGLILTAHAIPLFLIIRVGGQLADRWGSRWLVVGSMVFQVGAMVYLATLSDSVTPWWVALGVLAQSTGAAFSLAPLHKASTVGVPDDQTGVAAGLYSKLRFAGTVFGTALSGVILQQGLNRGLPVIEAYQMGFWFVASVAVVGAVLGSRLRV